LTVNNFTPHNNLIGRLPGNSFKAIAGIFYSRSALKRNGGRMNSPALFSPCRLWTFCPEVRGGCPGCRSPPRSFDFLRSHQKSNGGKLTMATINMKDFYPWYTKDEFVEVPDIIAAELFANRRYEKTQQRYARLNKQLSLDAEDGVESAASIQSSNSPEAVFDMLERHCALCKALNSLPETQGRRIEAHYILGKSKSDIARNDGVSEKNVRQSIERGLQRMKMYLKIYF
jgi:RNA polymerase sigma-70 factor (ECF subfamily)